MNDLGSGCVQRFVKGRCAFAVLSVLVASTALVTPRSAEAKPEGRHERVSSSCADEATTRSRGTGEKAPLRIVNATAHAVHLYWLDFGGKRRPYGTLAPNAVTTEDTYRGHAWIATDEGETCKALAIAGDGHEL